MEDLANDVVEARCLADYEALVGKVVLAHAMQCMDEDDCSDGIHLSPPAVVRIMPTNSVRDEIYRWMDDWNCDPIYNVEVLEPHVAFNKLRPSFVFGLSRSTDGTTAEADFELAPPEIQAKYAEAAVQEPGTRADDPVPRP